MHYPFRLLIILFLFEYTNVYFFVMQKCDLTTT